MVGRLGTEPPARVDALGLSVERRGAAPLRGVAATRRACGPRGAQRTGGLGGGSEKKTMKKQQGFGTRRIRTERSCS